MNLNPPLEPGDLQTLELTPLEIEALYGLVRVVMGLEGDEFDLNPKGAIEARALLAKLEAARRPLPGGLLGVTEALVEDLISAVKERIKVKA